MTTLHIVEIDKNDKLHRTEVEVLGRETINGVDCFCHFNGNFIVSHVESGCQIAKSDTGCEHAIEKAKFNLSDLSRLEMLLAPLRSKILDAGFLYPVNPMPI